jgi:prophage antirepressor-like protein
MSTENAVQVFEGEGFCKVRVVIEGDKPLFVARDIVTSLGLTWDGHRIDHVPSEWKGVVSVTTPGGKQQSVVLTEEGVNFYVIRSDSPKALPVQKWLAGTVMPSIRKHGAYLTPDVLAKTITDPAYIIGIVTALQQEQEARKLAEQKVLEYTPAHEFVQELEATGDVIYGDQMAKLICAATKLDIGHRKFFNWLRQNEFLFKQGRSFPNVITQKGITAGYILPKEEVHGGKIVIVPMFTVKGQMYFIDTFCEMVRNGFAGFDKQGHALYKGEGRAQLSLFTINGEGR